MSSSTTGSSQRILQTALNLFSAKGYDATSVREICQASGITKPTLYHFFGSKDGVFRALVQGALDSFELDVRRAVQPPGSAFERLRRVARHYFESAVRERDLVRLIFALVHSSPGGAPAADIPSFYERVLKLVGEVIEEGVGRGELQPGPTEIRLLAFMGALSEAVCGNLITGRLWLTPELADALVDTVVRGWRAPAGTEGP